MKLLPETVSSLHLLSKGGAESLVKPSGGKTIAIAVAAVALIAAVIFGTGLFSSKPVEHATPPPPVPVITSASSTSTGVAVTTKPAISTNTDTGTEKPSTFEQQYLVSENFEKFWKTNGGPGDFIWNEEDSAICLQETKGSWIYADHPLPASDYLLHIKMDTTNGVDDAEVRVGMGEKEYIACGIRLTTNDKPIIAYVERRDAGSDKTTGDNFSRGAGTRSKPEFFIRVSHRVATCRLGNELMFAPDFHDEKISPVLRIAVRKGIARFFTIDISPLTETK
jgi:hypothetical protein